MYILRQLNITAVVHV